MVRQTHHEPNQLFTIRPEPVEGLDQSFFNSVLTLSLKIIAFLNDRIA
jgi:hypothetical protein